MRIEDLIDLHAGFHIISQKNDLKYPEISVRFNLTSNLNMFYRESKVRSYAKEFKEMILQSFYIARPSC